MTIVGGPIHLKRRGQKRGERRKHDKRQRTTVQCMKIYVFSVVEKMVRAWNLMLRRGRIHQRGTAVP